MTIYANSEFLSVTAVQRLLRGAGRAVLWWLGLLASIVPIRSVAQVPAGDPVMNLWPFAATQITPTVTSTFGYDELTSPFYDNWAEEFHSGVGVAYDPNAGMYSGAFRSLLGTGFPNYLYAWPASTRTNGYIIRFKSNSPSLVIGVKEALAYFHLMVDGQVVSQVLNPIFNGHLLQYTFDFGSSQNREIQILADHFQFQGIHVQNSSYSITPFPDAGPRAVFIGDSISEGGVNSLSFVVGRLLGWTTWNLPWGATGYIEDANGARTNFYDRSDEDIIRPNPDIVVINGGINDNVPEYTPAYFQFKVGELFDKVNAQLPNATKIVVGPFWPNGSPTAFLLEKRNIVQSVAAAKGFHFIDWVGWITGNQAVPNSGNANTYISTDTTHPTHLGRMYLGARLAAEIATHLGQPIPGTLDSLAINAGPLTPAFSPSVRNYVLNLPYSTANLVLTPAAAFPGTTVEMRVGGGSYVPVTLGTASPALPLAVGPNTVDVKVSGRDGMILTHYTIQASRTPASSNADLAALEITAASLAPNFDPETTTYNASVPSAQTDVAVVPTPEDANALVAVTGGGSLLVGENPVAVEVTAEDGVTEKTYAVTVIRPPPPITFWRIAQFGAQATDSSVAGDLANPAGDGIPNLCKYALGLDPFSPTTGGLPALSVESGLASLTYTKLKSATDVVYQVVWSDDLANWSPDGVIEEIVPGSETATTWSIRARIPSAGADRRFACLRVIRMETGTNAGLASLQTSTGTLSPAFNAATTSYTVNVPNGVTSFSLTPTVQDPIAAVTVTGGSNLVVGANTMTVQVTAEDGVTIRTYTIVVNRLPPPNTPPSVAISAPVTGLGFALGEAVAFAAAASDVQDDDSALTASIQWSSNLDGPLGTGGSISRNNLSIGTHTITASVTDSGGLPAQAGVAVSVVASVVPPLSGSLVLHLESTQGVSASGGNVTTWSDRSGRGNHVSAGGSPQWGAVLTPTGRPAISLNGNGDKLDRNGSLSGLPAGNGERTMFVVGKYNSSTAWAGVTYGTAASNQAFGLYIKHPTGELGLHGFGTGNDLISTTPGIGAGWLVQSAVVQGGTATLFKDGASIGQFAHSYNTALSRLVIGQDLASQGFAGMDVSAVLVYNRALSAIERAGVEDYLRGRHLVAGGPNTPPVVAISSPANGAAVTAGDTVAFTAAAADTQDDVGVLTGSIVWSSDRDGVIGTGGSFATGLLSSGTHTITASVLDTRGAPASASVIMVVFPQAPPPLGSSLVLHFDSTQGVAASNGNVTSWLDQSGRQNHVSASGSPKWGIAQTPAGRPAITFNGTGDKLEKIGGLAGLPAGNANRTMFVVAKYNSSTAWAGVAYGTGAQNQAFGLYIRHPTGELGLHGWGGGNDLISTTPGIGAGWLIQSGVISNGTATMFKDGAQIAQFAHNYNTTLSKLVLGAEIANLGYVGMDVSAVLVYDRALNATERASVEDYLRGKFIQGTPPPVSLQLAQAYAGRLAVAGNTLSGPRLTAFSNYIESGLTDGWWDHLVDIHPYEGGTVAQVSVKLKGSGALAPTGFANNHILANGGLQGAAGRHFDTGVSLDSLPFGTAGIMCWLLDATADGGEQRLMGTWGATPEINLWKGAGAGSCNANANGALAKSLNFGPGLWRASRRSTTLAELSHNSAILNRRTDSTPAASGAAPIFTFNAGNGPGGCLNKIGFTAIDDGLMSATQEAAHFRALAQLMDDLGRINRSAGRMRYALMIGQSLADGGGASAGVALSTSQPYNNRMKLGVSPIIHDWAVMDPVNIATEDLGYFSLLRESGRETSCSGFANQVAAFRRAESPGSDSEDITINNYAVGGWAYSQLKKGTNPYEQSIKSVQAASRAWPSLRKAAPLELDGVLAVHGESDAYNLSYRYKIEQWQADYTVDAAATTGQTGQVPMFHSQPSSWTSPYSSNAAISYSPYGILDAFYANPAKSVLVCPKYFIPPSDGLHLTNYGYRWLGEYYAKAWWKVVVKGEAWSPLCPIPDQITLNGAVITIPFAGAMGSLVLDTTIITQLPDGKYGFEYHDNSDAPPAISSVAVNGSSVIVTLASVPTGKNAKIRYAYTGIPGNEGGPSNGPRGCLRDSDPAVGESSGAPLYNWCVHFSLPVPTPGPWSPLDVRGCTLYLDADSVSGSTSDPVASWTDSSGSGNTVSQATAANKPTLVAADSDFNGHNSIQFGPLSKMSCNPARFPERKTIFVVGKETGISEPVSALITFNDWPSLANGLYFQHGYPNFIWTCGPGFYELVNRQLLPSKWVISQVYDASSTPLYINGTLYPDPVFRGLDADRITIGSSGGTGNFYVRAKIAAILVYDRPLSGSDRAQIEAYLEAKYGL